MNRSVAAGMLRSWAVTRFHEGMDFQAGRVACSSRTEAVTERCVAAHTVSVKDLAAALQLDYGTVTPLIKRLEASCLLRRERRVDDERVVQVALTEEGLALHRRLSSLPPMIGDAVGLTPEEIATLQDLARRMTVNVNRHDAAAARRTA